MADPLSMIPLIPAWLVLDRHGGRGVFLEHSRALTYAAQHHNTLHALVVPGSAGCRSYCNNCNPKEPTHGGPGSSEG